MKLIVEVNEYKDQCSTCAYLKSDSEEDMVYDPIGQAENVARLCEVAKEIEKTAKAYYARESALMPKVSKKPIKATKVDEFGNVLTLE